MQGVCLVLGWKLCTKQEWDWCSDKLEREDGMLRSCRWKEEGRRKKEGRKEGICTVDNTSDTVAMYTSKESSRGFICHPITEREIM